VSKRFLLTTPSTITYIDNNLLAAEGQDRTHELLSDLCSMHTTAISDPREEKWSAVF
jgi:hypothetical protein